MSESTDEPISADEQARIDNVKKISDKIIIELDRVTSLMDVFLILDRAKMDAIDNSEIRNEAEFKFVLYTVIKSTQYTIELLSKNFEQLEQCQKIDGPDSAS